MSALQQTTQSNGITSAHVMGALPTFPQKIAQQLAPLIQSTDIETYKHFLATMYHYTYNAEEQLMHASESCTDPVLKEYFYHMAREERGHYLLAKRDYEEFGDNIERTKAPESVKNFQDYWYGLGQDNVNEFIGAMYVFENVASAVAKDVIEMMQRLQLTRKQSRWLRVHLEADVGHGDEAREMCERYVNDNPAAMLMAADVGAEEWASVFRYAFSNSAKKLIVVN